jgi:hypothetical protein
MHTTKYLTQCPGKNHRKELPRAVPPEHHADNETKKMDGKKRRKGKRPKTPREKLKTASQQG